MVAPPRSVPTSRRRGGGAGVTTSYLSLRQGNLNSRASLHGAMRCDAMGMRGAASAGWTTRARDILRTTRVKRGGGAGAGAGAPCDAGVGVGITETVESCPYKNTRDDVALFIILPHDTLYSDEFTARLHYFCNLDNILSYIVTTSSITTLTFSSFKIIYTYP